MSFWCQNFFQKGQQISKQNCRTADSAKFEQMNLFFYPEQQSGQKNNFGGRICGPTILFRYLMTFSRSLKFLILSFCLSLKIQYIHSSKKKNQLICYLVQTLENVMTFCICLSQTVLMYYFLMFQSKVLHELLNSLPRTSCFSKSNLEQTRMTSLS